MSRLVLWLSCLYILSVVFAPPIPGKIGATLRYEDAILIAAFGVALLLQRRRSRAMRSTGIAKPLFFLCYLFLLMMMLSVLRDGTSLVGLPKELLRLGKYVMVVVVFYSLLPSQQPVIATVVILAGVGTVLLQIAQRYGGLEFNSWLVQFYGSPSHLSDVLEIVRAGGFGIRAGANFSNPNVAGTFLVIPFGLTLWNLFDTYSKDAKDTRSFDTRKVSSFVLLVLMFIGIVLSESRASFAAALVAVLCSSLLVIKKKTNRSRMIILLLVMGMLGVAVASLLDIRIASLGAYAEGYDTSYSIKLANLSTALDQITDQSAVFGLGPGNGPQVDFEYGYFLSWYGPLGLIVCGVLWGIILVPLFLNRSIFRKPEELIVIGVALLVMNLSQTTFLVARVFPIFIALYVVNLNRVPVSLASAVDMSAVGGKRVTHMAHPAALNSLYPRQRSARKAGRARMSRSKWL